MESLPVVAGLVAEHRPHFEDAVAADTELAVVAAVVRIAAGPLIVLVS